MRFLVGEQPYETAVSSGQYKYHQDDAPTGAVESWRKTVETNGFQIMRVDLDLRDTENGGSFLYHLVQDEHGNNVRLTYRYFDQGCSVRGNVIFEDEFITNSRERDDKRYEEQFPRASFVFPTTFGLGEIGRLGDWTFGGLLLLNMYDKEHAEQFLALNPVEVSQEKHDDTEKIDLKGKQIDTKKHTIHFLNQTRTVWLTEDNLPLKMQRNDGLTAQLTRFITYH